MTERIAPPETDLVLSVIEGVLPAIAEGHAEQSATAYLPDSSERSGWRSGLRRAFGVLALAGVVALGGPQGHAEAAPPDTIAAQEQSQGSGSDWFTGSAILGLAVTVAISAYNSRKQREENTADRFSDALRDISGDSTGEQRASRLRPLGLFIRNRRYAPEVFETEAEYLRSRREGIDDIRKKYDGDPEMIEHLIKARRNADRTALKQLARTLPAARRQLRRQEAAKQILNFVTQKKDKWQVLDEQTGTLPDTEKPRVDASGINLDDMRGIKKFDFEDLDLTGAGLQRLQITRVILKRARLCEAQLEGTTISRSDLRGADLRAAYFGNTKIERCVVDKDTKFGNFPDNHPDAKHGSLRPESPDEYRGDPRVILKDLKSDTLRPDEIEALVRQWQRNGLVLLKGSNPEYFLREPD